jgi:undecaprenyl-diphosphatase
MTLRTYAAPLFLILLAFCIGLAVNAGLTTDLDKSLLGMIAMREGKSPDLAIDVMQAASFIGDSSQRALWIVVFAAFLFWRRRPRAAIVMIVAPVLASVTSSVLKEIFARPRPSIVPHLDHVTNLSFPSGHAVNAAALFLLAALLLPGRGPRTHLVLAGAVAAMIGFSRMALGVHYPTDVASGWLIGAAFAFAGFAVAKAWEAPRR